MASPTATHPAAPRLRCVEEELSLILLLFFPTDRTYTSCTLAGAYIGMGFSLCCLVGGLLSEELRLEQPGLFNFLFSIFGFPMGLTLCVVAGADLFTSNCMYTTIGLAEGGWPGKGAANALSPPMHRCCFCCTEQHAVSSACAQASKEQLNWQLPLSRRSS